MTTPDASDPLHAAIDATLAEVVKASPAAAWHEAWLALGPGSTEGERLRVYQAVRDAGVLPDEAGLYLVAWQADAIAGERVETELHALDEQLREIEAAHGGDGEGDWADGKAPSEFDEQLDRQQTAWDDLFARTLREYGEDEIAEQFERDREGFERLHEEGRRFFHGPAEEDWIDDLAGAVAGCTLADDPMGSIGYCFQEEDGCWEVDLYPTPVELLGGAADGALVAPGFSLDLLQLQALFGRVDAVSWNTHGYHGSDAPFISVEGAYEGRDVWLRVLCAAPDDEEPGLKIKVSR
jgi:hypothetical protein